MRFFVVGGAGFIGSHLADLLVEVLHLVLDRDAPHLLKFHQDSGFTYEVTDLLTHDGANIANPANRSMKRPGSPMMPPRCR